MSLQTGSRIHNIISSPRFEIEGEWAVYKPRVEASRVGVSSWESRGNFYAL